jgi:hypothetical protein
VKFKVKNAQGKDMVINIDAISAYTRFAIGDGTGDYTQDECLFTGGSVFYIDSDTAEDLWNELKKNL